jgi:hypothetical protein
MAANCYRRNAHRKQNDTLQRRALRCGRLPNQFDRPPGYKRPTVNSISSTPTSRTARRIDGGLLVLAALAILALIALGWGFTMRTDLDDARGQNADLQAEIDQLRAQANATAYTLAPGAGAPENALGTAFFTLDGTGVITVANLEPAPEGRSYQVWYYPTDNAEPIPGATFAVDEHGTGFTLIPADVGLFTSITVTLEPEAGVTSPSGPVILTGSTGGARG